MIPIDYGCCCYHKGRNFQANHNMKKSGLKRLPVVVATTKVGIFKQITTTYGDHRVRRFVVVATTKVGIFKQITTTVTWHVLVLLLLLLPQR